MAEDGLRQRKGASVDFESRWKEVQDANEKVHS